MCYSIHEETVTAYNAVTNGPCVSSIILWYNVTGIKLRDLRRLSITILYAISSMVLLCTHAHQSLNLTGFAKPIPIGIITEIHLL